MTNLEIYCRQNYGCTIGEYARRHFNGDINEAKTALLDDWKIDNGNESLGALTEEGKQIEKALRRKERAKSENGYAKKYPSEKMELYNGLKEWVLANGGIIQEMEKCNYRNLKFMVGNTKYEIVLSEPRN